MDSTSAPYCPPAFNYLYYLGASAVVGLMPEPLLYWNFVQKLPDIVKLIDGVAMAVLPFVCLAVFGYRAYKYRKKYKGHLDVPYGASLVLWGVFQVIIMTALAYGMIRLTGGVHPLKT